MTAGQGAVNHGNAMDKDMMEEATFKVLRKLGYVPTTREYQRKKAQFDIMKEGNREYKKSTEATPKQKIGNSIRGIKKQIREIDKTIDYALRLKNEMEVKSGNYWKNTSKDISKIEEKLNKISHKLKELSK